MDRFRELMAMIESDPARYRAEVARLRYQEPAVFANLIEVLRQEVETSNLNEDRPLTPEEVEELTSSAAEELGWSRSRLVAEAVLRLVALWRLDPVGFSSLTPEETPASRRAAYRRHTSSIQALILGDVRALLEKHERARLEDPKKK